MTDKGRKIISGIFFGVAVIFTFIFTVEVWEEPAVNTYRGEMLYSTTAEVGELVGSISVEQYKSIIIENISGDLPDNASDRIMVRVKINATAEHEEMTFIPHETMGASILIISLSVLAFSAVIAFAWIWPHRKETS